MKKPKASSRASKADWRKHDRRVTEAARERLDRVCGERGVGLADRLLKIGEDCAAHLREPFRSVDHGELLYDEKGLPR
jgi:antitoxin VapB